MTTDYISIDRLVSAFNDADGDICDYCGGCETCGGFAGEYGFSTEKIMEIIGNAPSAGLEELVDYCKQRHAENLYHNHGLGLVALIKCEKCGRVVPELAFCGYCGADLRGNTDG